MLGLKLIHVSKKGSLVDCVSTLCTRELYTMFHQTSDMMRTLVGNKIVDYLDVFWVSPVGTAPTISSFLT